MVIEELHILIDANTVEKQETTLSSKPGTNGSVRASAATNTTTVSATMNTKVIWEKYGAWFDSETIFFNALRKGFGPVYIDPQDYQKAVKKTAALNVVKTTAAKTTAKKTTAAKTTAKKTTAAKTTAKKTTAAKTATKKTTAVKTTAKKTGK